MNFYLDAFVIFFIILDVSSHIMTKIYLRNYGFYFLLHIYFFINDLFCRTDFISMEKNRRRLFCARVNNLKENTNLLISHFTALSLNNSHTHTTKTKK